MTSMAQKETMLWNFYLWAKENIQLYFKSQALEITIRNSLLDYEKPNQFIICKFSKLTFSLLIPETF